MLQSLTTSAIKQKSHSTHKTPVRIQPPLQHFIGATGHLATVVLATTSPPGKETASSNRSNHLHNHRQNIENDYVRPSKETDRSISQPRIARPGVYSELVNFRSSNNGSTHQAPQMGTNYYYQILSDTDSSNNKAHSQRNFPEGKIAYNPSLNNEFRKGYPKAGYAKPKLSFLGPSVMDSSSPS